MTTPTNDRQTSERERLADDLERFGHSSTDCDSAVWQAVAQLRAVEAEIAQLNRLVELRSNEAVDNLDEAIRLRAENEALRTVTEEDAIRVLSHTGGTPAAARKALQSFIRSKESRRG